MALTWPKKDPDEVLDFVIDWTDRLAGDTIVTSEFILPTSPAGLARQSQSVSGQKKTVVWLMGGVLGSDYLILNRIVTAGGRTMDQTVKLPIRAK